MFVFFPHGIVFMLWGSLGLAVRRLVVALLGYVVVALVGYLSCNT